MSEPAGDQDDRSTYGTTVAKPDAKAGVEVGGGEKAAAREKADRAAREGGPKEGSDSPRERRPEGPHADPKHTNPDATPGAGTLPDGEDQDATGG